MKKFKALSLIIIMFLIIGCGNAIKKIEEKEGYLIYKSPSKTYGFLYPEDWEINSSEENIENLVISSPDGLSNFFVEINPKPDMSYKEYLNFTKSTYLDGGMSYTESTVTYNDIEYTKLFSDSSALQYILYIGEYNNNRYLLSIISLQTSYSSDYTKELEEIVKSFTVFK